MDGWISAISTWAYFGAVALCLITALLRKKETASALGWSLAIIFLPVIGIGLFLLIGRNRVSGRLRKKIQHRLAFPSPLESVDTVPPEVRDRHIASPEEQGWRAIERMLVDLDQAPRRIGNRVDLLDNGVAAFEAMQEAIAAATHHVHVEFFIFRDDELGQRATEALVRKAREGVQVRVIVDGVGSRGNRRLLRSIRAAGGEGVRFLPVRLFGRATPHLRNHRKIVICDGKVAFFGGLNVGIEYLGRRRNRGRDWYDLHVRLEGPSVWDLQEVFLEDWDFASGSAPPPDPFFPIPTIAGDAPVQIIAGGPDLTVNPVRQAFIAAFTRARRSIRIFTPYLVPDLTLRDTLTSAARSGIEVEVITQFPPADHFAVQLCGEYFMHELLEAGVRIYGYSDGMMHAKAVTVDESWSMIGTANLDNRSLHLNFEQMAILDGAAQVASLEAAFSAVRGRCRPYSLEGLAARSAPRRVLSNASRLLAPLL